ncbi:MAG: hypothetical protein OXC80_01660 [Gammaproteobacteria bacterium]|nr:hypothetical protein [Gammaproteobacteria bacterium]
MPPDTQTQQHQVNWTFRAFILAGALILFGSIAWLVWAMVKFGPTSDEDILRSLLSDQMFAPKDLLITRRNSDCGTQGIVKGNVSADLYEAFALANEGQAPDPVGLQSLNPRQRVVDSSQTPREWYVAENTPVISISNIGVNRREALVCLDIHSRYSSSFLIKLYRQTSTFWEITEEIKVLEEVPPPEPEEIPPSVIPEVGN